MNTARQSSSGSLLLHFYRLIFRILNSTLSLHHNTGSKQCPWQITLNSQPTKTATARKIDDWRRVIGYWSHPHQYWAAAAAAAAAAAVWRRSSDRRIEKVTATRLIECCARWPNSKSPPVVCSSRLYCSRFGSALIMATGRGGERRGCELFDVMSTNCSLPVTCMTLRTAVVQPLSVAPTLIRHYWKQQKTIGCRRRSQGRARAVLCQEEAEERIA